MYYGYQKGPFISVLGLTCTKSPDCANKVSHSKCDFGNTNVCICTTNYVEEFTVCKGEYISTLLKEPFALKNSETVYFTSIFSTLSYSDFALINKFDLIFFYFYFVFETFENNSVLTL